MEKSDNSLEPLCFFNDFPHLRKSAGQELQWEMALFVPKSVLAK